MDLNLILTEAQEAIRQKAHEFAKKEINPYVKEWFLKDSRVLKELVRKAVPYGLVGVTIPKKYGGLDLTATEWLIMVEELTRVAQSNIGFLPPYITSGPGPSVLMRSTNEAMKKKYLPRLARGEISCSIGITEPLHGSDMTYMETSATAHGDDYIINGEKRFITAGVESEICTLFARFDGIPRAAGVGIILIERDMPGVTANEYAVHTGDRGRSAAHIILKNVRVPKENLLFENGRITEFLTGFNMDRLVVAGAAVAIAEAAYDEALKYVTENKRFETEIINFQAIQHDLANMWTDIQAGRLLAYRAACTAHEGKFPDGLECSVAKLYTTEMSLRVILTAIRMMGGTGTMRESVVQRLWGDALTMLTGGGTTQILRNSIAQWLVPERRLSRGYR